MIFVRIIIPTSNCFPAYLRNRGRIQGIGLRLKQLFTSQPSRPSRNGNLICSESITKFELIISRRSAIADKSGKWIRHHSPSKVSIARNLKRPNTYRVKYFTNTQHNFSRDFNTCHLCILASAPGLYPVYNNNKANLNSLIFICRPSNSSNFTIVRINCFVLKSSHADGKTIFFAFPLYLYHTTINLSSPVTGNG